MKVLIYKRTHKGDPDIQGIFGNQDCMGRMREWNFDAVIGIGGNSPWKEDRDIRHKINWIGLGPKKSGSNERGASIVFSHFALFEEKGMDIEQNFPHLFRYMYQSRKRFDMSKVLPENVFQEVKLMLESAKKYPESPAYYNENPEEFMTSTHSDAEKCRSFCRKEGS